MQKKNDNLREFIVLDLETIGLDKESGKIIEIAALRVKDWEVVSEYCRLIDPEMKIPPASALLCGIRDSDVKGQPKIGECLPDFLRFIGDLPLVGHNILSFDKPFLEYNLKQEKIAEKIGNSVFDTLELSLFLLPEIRRHKLEYLYKKLVAKNAKQTHRAKDDCLMTLAVLRSLAEVRDLEWDKSWLDRVGALAKSAGWTWADFILERRESLDFGQKNAGILPFEDYLENIDWSRLKKYNTQDNENASKQNDASAQNIKADQRADVEKSDRKIDSEEIQKVFAENGGPGSLRAVLGPQYEYRRQQEEMALKTAECINTDVNLVLEAPTGCGKSLGYLVPALLWSLKNQNWPAVISTYTNALQDQLYESDFRHIKEIYGKGVKIVVAKGREHYLCIRKAKRQIEDIIQSQEKFFLAGERFSPHLFAVFFANWIIRSKGSFCDLDRFPFWLRKKTDAFAPRDINSTRDTCQGRFCEYYNKCLISKLKLAAREANVVITNHSLVLSDAWNNPSRFSILPPNFRVLVIDEAINIEDAATSASEETFAKNEFASLIRDFAGTARRKGFAHAIAGQMRNAGNETLFARAEKIIFAARQMEKDSDELFRLTQCEFGARKSEYGERAEIFPAFLERVAVPLQNIVLRLSEIIVFLDMSAKLCAESAQSGLGREAKNYLEKFAGYQSFFSVLSELDKRRYIFYRAKNADSSDLSLNYCHKDIGKYLDANLYGRGLKSIIFTSATLTHDGRFDFINKIWGLSLIPKERLEYLRLPYLFDYSKQCALIFVDELPNRGQDNTGSNNREFYVRNHDFLKRIIVANNGSALLLFTNKKDAAKFGELLAADLEAANIPLYSTEKSLDPRIMSGSKSGIVEEFKESVESCLIGTAGLREGINIPGPSLELVLIIRMPFSVPTDPIHQNRSAIYGGFPGYSLPQCLFAIKQAFGRLIRSQSDSGFVVIADERVRKYAPDILANLPPDLHALHLSLSRLKEFEELLIKTKSKKDRVRMVGGLFV